MTLTRWEPFREIVSLREAMDRMFDEGFIRPFRAWPHRFDGELGGVPLDMYETEEALVIKASVPGVKTEDIDITVTGNMLTIKGEFRKEEEGKRGTVHFEEREYGRFQRSVSLPNTVNPDKARAEFEAGVLKLTLPKIEEAKPKHIEVKPK
jgi:HSP20 family protein